MSVTIVTCYYIKKSKFNNNQYLIWIKNLLNNVNNFNLVIYVDKNSFEYINNIVNNNPKIKIIIKEMNEFYTYKYKDFWIKNHEKNILLKDKITWEINMLYSEKINFIKDACENKYFENNIYIWCDIGYFRCGKYNLPYQYISTWPNPNKIKTLNSSKIYYGQVCNNNYLNQIKNQILDKNKNNLPKIPINPGQVSIAGGFFIIHKNNIQWWWNTYYNKLKLYFDNNYLVKDDQMIIIDSISNNFSKFELIKQQNNNFDRWFAFDTFLL
tara:strand:- start:4734 stop:5540 length:807 start_codon:yes stop_codon:yes gene_type:complete